VRDRCRRPALDEACDDRRAIWLVEREHEGDERPVQSHLLEQLVGRGRGRLAVGGDRFSRDAPAIAATFRPRKVAHDLCEPRRIGRLVSGWRRHAAIHDSCTRSSASSPSLASSSRVASAKRRP
jgi:hypothetical protein